MFPSQLLAIACASLVVVGDERLRTQCTRDQFGRGVASIGDIDGDGFDDLVITAIGQDDPRTQRTEGGAIFAFSGRDGAVLYTVWSDREAGPHRAGGGELSPLGDWNGDGVAEFAETMSDAIRCGRDGEVLVRLQVEPARDNALRPIVGVGDCNGDGVPDVALSVRGETSCGTVRVHSGKDGRLVRELRGPCGSGFGFAIDSGVDVDRDGVFDLLVGCPVGAEEKRPRANGGMVRAISIVTGCELWSVEARAPGDRFGESVAWIGDVDRDGHADFAVGAPGLSEYGIRRRSDWGYVRVYSGATRALLHTIEGPRNAPDIERDASFGHALARVGDVDGNGAFDLVVGAPREGVLAGSARVYSSVTGTSIHAFIGPGLSDWGANVAAAGDIDADGTPDVAVVAMNETVGANNIGAVALFSGRTGALVRWLQSPITWPK